MGTEANTVCRMMARLVTPGKYEVVVKNEVGVSNALIFEVNEAVSTDLEITSFTPLIIHSVMVALWALVESWSGHQPELNIV